MAGGRVLSAVSHQTLRATRVPTGRVLPISAAETFRQRLPFRGFEHDPLIRRLSLEHYRPEIDGIADRGEIEQGVGQDNQGGTGQGRPHLAAAQIGDADGKGGDECPPEGYGLGSGNVGLMLQILHFLLKADKEDQRDQRRQAEDEKGQHHHQWTVGELEGRMYAIDDGDKDHQDAEKGDDALVDRHMGKEQPLQAIGEGHEQGDIKEHPRQHVLLGPLDVVVHPGDQRQAGSGVLVGAAVLEVVFVGSGPGAGGFWHLSSRPRMRWLTMEWRSRLSTLGITRCIMSSAACIEVW